MICTHVDNTDEPDNWRKHFAATKARCPDMTEFHYVNQRTGESFTLHRWFGFHFMPLSPYAAGMGCLWFLLIFSIIMQIALAN